MDISGQAWERLIAAGMEQRFGVGEILLRQGDSPSYVVLLVEGWVKVLVNSRDGRVLLLAVRGPGEILGVMGAVSGKARSATVVAVDQCVTRVLAADEFRGLIRSAGLEAELLQGAMHRILEGETWRAETAALPARPRIVRALVRLAAPNSGRCDVRLNQTEIGQAVGLSRSVVAAELAWLREQGIVVTGHQRITITDMRRLQALAALGHESV